MDTKTQLELGILPVVFRKSKCMAKVRRIEPNEKVNRYYTVNEQGSFQITHTVEPFYKKVL
jgi:hypothetical protein